MVPGVPEGNIQPSLWRCTDGRLRMVVRTTRAVGRVGLAESSDDGRTWSAVRPTSLPHPNAGLDAVKLADGRVLLVYNHAPQGRTPLSLALSDDDGDTWRTRRALEDGPGEYSYPAVIQARRRACPRLLHLAAGADQTRRALAGRPVGFVTE